MAQIITWVIKWLPTDMLFSTWGAHKHPRRTRTNKHKQLVRAHMSTTDSNIVRIVTQTHTETDFHTCRTLENMVSSNTLTRPDPQVCLSVCVIFIPGLSVVSDPSRSHLRLWGTQRRLSILSARASPLHSQNAQTSIQTTSPKQRHTRTDWEVCVDTDRKEERGRERERGGGGSTLERRCSFYSWVGSSG